MEGVLAGAGHGHGLEEGGTGLLWRCILRMKVEGRGARAAELAVCVTTSSPSSIVPPGLHSTRKNTWGHAVARTPRAQWGGCTRRDSEATTLPRQRLRLARPPPRQGTCLQPCAYWRGVGPGPLA